MKSRTRLLLSATATLLLAACATTDQYTSVSPAYDAKMVNDAAYIAAVESIAAGRGVDVKWVNPPKVRVEDD